MEVVGNCTINNITSANNDDKPTPTAELRTYPYFPNVPLLTIRSAFPTFYSATTVPTQPASSTNPEKPSARKHNIPLGVVIGVIVAFSAVISLIGFFVAWKCAKKVA